MFPDWDYYITKIFIQDERVVKIYFSLWKLKQQIFFAETLIEKRQFSNLRGAWLPASPFQHP